MCESKGHVLAKAHPYVHLFHTTVSA